MKLDLSIEDIISNQILAIEDNKFESFSILKDIIVLSNYFRKTLNEKQKNDFDKIIDKIDYYETAKAQEIVRLAIFLYKNLWIIHFFYF